MNEAELRLRFPKASDDFIRRNILPARSPEFRAALAEIRKGDVHADKKRLRQKSGDGMNATERAFFEYLPESRSGKIYVQSITLKLGNGVRYTPDFIVVDEGNLHLTAYEVKGFMRDDAAVKIKVAASLYPWIDFRLVTKKKKRDGGGWAIENVLP